MAEPSLSSEARKKLILGIRIYLVATVIVWVVPSIVLLASHKSGSVAAPSDFAAIMLQLSLNIPIVELRHLNGADFNDGAFRFFALAYLKMAATLPAVTLITVLLTFVFGRPLSQLFVHPNTGKTVVLGSIFALLGFCLLATGFADVSTRRSPFRFTDFDISPAKLFLMDVLTYGVFLRAWPQFLTIK